MKTGNDVSTPTVVSPSVSPAAKVSLNALVRQSLEAYLAELEGEPPSHLYNMVMKQVEPALLEVVLFYTEGKISHAAKMLGIDRGTLSKKLDRYDIDPKNYKSSANRKSAESATDL